VLVLYFYILFICVILIIVCFLLFIFLVFFSVCEGSLGLSILVSIIRSHDNDYFQFTEVNKYFRNLEAIN